MGFVEVSFDIGSIVKQWLQTSGEYRPPRKGEWWIDPYGEPMQAEHDYPSYVCVHIAYWCKEGETVIHIPKWRDDMGRFERIKKNFERLKGKTIIAAPLSDKDIEWLIKSHIEQEEEIKRLQCLQEYTTVITPVKPRL